MKSIQMRTTYYSEISMQGNQPLLLAFGRGLRQAEEWERFLVGRKREGRG